MANLTHAASTSIFCNINHSKPHQKSKQRYEFSNFSIPKYKAISLFLIAKWPIPIWTREFTCQANMIEDFMRKVVMLHTSAAAKRASN